ncbi:uncharacterized protein LOC116263566 [Nymphaea colorata]|nr:uncharacterized protein LOC116263566 [Nymphaea colorata]
MSRKMQHLQQCKMASLTPGVLLKLLERLKSRSTVPSGDHKPILLQVISIVPSLTGSGLWSSQGYFLKVSDSSHSTYVSLTADDNDLICTDKLHLGQFIYIDKMVEGNPVPLALGVRPLQGRHPFVGTPKDLMQMMVISEDDDCESLPEKKVGNSAGGGGWEGDNEKLNIRASIKEEKVSVASRYLKSSTDGKQKKGGDGGGREGGGGKKVEELGVAKDRTVGKKSGISEEVKDKGIKNRSTKEQKKQRNRTQDQRPVSAGRYLSRKENKDKAPGISTTPPCEQVSNSSKPKASATGKSSPTKAWRKPDTVKATARTDEGESPRQAISDNKKPTTCSSTWKSLPPEAVKLGKEVVRRRNVASFAAALALEEAAAAESLVKCLSMLSSLQSSSSSADIPLTFAKFFDLHQTLICAKKNSSLAIFSGKDKLNTSKDSQNRSSCIVSIETQQKEKIEWRTGDGGKEILELRAVLLKESEAWFLDFLEKALESHGRKTPASGRSRLQRMDVRSAIGIPEMKSINDWLDGWLVRKKEEGSEVGEVNDTVERLKKKCYEYLLSQ